MANKILIFILTLCGLALFQSCDDYFFEEVETNQFEGLEKEWVVNAYFYQTRKFLSLRMYETVSPGENPFQTLKQGYVMVEQEGDTLFEDSIRLLYGDTYGLEVGLNGFNSTRSITLHVWHPRYGQSSATVSPIGKPMRKNYSRKHAAKKHEFFGNLDEIEFTFIQPSELTLQILSAHYTSNPIFWAYLYSKQHQGVQWASSNDYYFPDFKFIGIRFAFDHTVFQAESDSINFSFFSNMGTVGFEPTPTDSIWFYVETYDFNLANYAFQLSQQDTALRNPFLTPKEIRGNWSNSLGYFGIIRTDSI
mgnify:CR=1 FL=1